MPWTVADVDKHKKGLSDRQKQQWIEVANSALQACIKKGRSQSDCEGLAIRQANSVVGNNEAQYALHHVKVNNYTIRTEIHQGKKHLVVPVVMMVEGVHAGSHGPLLHLAEDLGRFPDTWNGIPVVIWHPEQDGQFISANSPEIIEKQTTGRVYNTHMDGSKLKAEAWIEEEKCQQISPVTLGYIRQGRPLELSVGVFTKDQMISGIWNNESYDGIARNHHPDHLALLPGGQGACSWDDGCGVRVNERFEPPESGDAPEAVKDILSRVYNECRSGWVKDHPSDKENAANKTSCSRIAWHAVEQAGWHKQGNRWIKAHQTNLSEGGGGVNELLDTFKELNYEGFSVIQMNEQGFKEKIAAIQSKLDRMDDDAKVHYLQEVYDSYCIYEIRSRMEGGGNSLYRRNYQTKQDGSIEFTGESAQVQRKVEYVTMQKGDLETMADNDKKKRCPKCIEKAGLLIQSKHSTFQEADREWLETLEETYLDKLLAMQKKEDPPQVNKEQAIQVLREEFKTPEQFINLMPEEMRDQMRSGLKLHQEQKTELIKRITDYTKDKEGSHTEDELKNMSMENLQKITSYIPVQANYSGLGGGSPTMHTEEVEPLGFPGIDREEKK